MAESTAKCEISQEHLECPICLRRFQNPKILDCLHSFCRNCLEDLVSKYEPDADKVICPVCRKATEIPDSRLENVKNCFFLSSLVDDVNKREKLLGETSASNLICEECEDGLEAVSRCLDCSANICQQCQAAHKRFKHTKQHRIVSDLSPRRQNVTANDPHAPKCTQHPDYNLSLYCETCKILICAMCGAFDHRTAEHTFTSIADAIGSHRKDVDDVLRKFQKSEDEFQALQESISHSRKRLKLMATKACDDISAKEKGEIAKIKTKAQLLRDEITQISKDRDEEYAKVFNSNRDKMERAKTIVTAVSDLMERADYFETLDLRPKIMHNLEFQEELLFEQGDHKESFIGVICQDVVSKTDLGGILHKEKWLLKNEFEGEETKDGEFRAHSICTLKNGDIVVMHTDAVSVFTPDGCFKTSFNPEDGLQAAPYGIAVTRDDLILVTDGDMVKVFNTDQQLIRQFRPAQDESGQLQKSELTCIAADEQNRVAVADKERNVVYVTNLDGSVISIIPTDIWPGEIAFQHDDRLILSLYGRKMLLCLDFSGHEVFTINTETNGEPMRPSGVCCDEAGDIYVTVVHPSVDMAGRSELHHYTAQGIHVECIAHGLFWPFDMTISPRGELLVADQNSVKKFLRV